MLQTTSRWRRQLRNPLRRPQVMCRHLRLNLDVLPWPINVLKFSQAVHDLQPGDDMTASISDGDVVGNLRQLLKCQSNVRYDVTRSNNDGHIIHVTRARSPL